MVVVANQETYLNICKTTIKEAKDNPAALR
jgi:hypothetical protein